MILLTDGYDENSTTRYRGRLAEPEGAQATVYVVGIGGVAGISLKGETRPAPHRHARRAAVPSCRPARINCRSSMNRHWPTTSSTLSDQLHAGQSGGRWHVARDLGSRPRSRNTASHPRPGYFAPKPPPVRPTHRVRRHRRWPATTSMSPPTTSMYRGRRAAAGGHFPRSGRSPCQSPWRSTPAAACATKKQTLSPALAAFTAALRPQDQLAVLLFSDSAEFTHDLSTNRDTTRDRSALTKPLAERRSMTRSAKRSHV